jgi:hypothetical protein
MCNWTEGVNQNKENIHDIFVNSVTACRSCDPADEGYRLTFYCLYYIQFNMDIYGLYV